MRRDRLDAVGRMVRQGTGPTSQALVRSGVAEALNIKSSLYQRPKALPCCTSSPRIRSERL